jgi:hypothetical protein
LSGKEAAPISEYMRRWGFCSIGQLVWVMVFVAYIAVLAFYYALKVDVPIAVFIGLILEAYVSIARTLKMEQRSR